MEVIETLRQFRIGSFTVFDTATAYFGIFLIAPVLSRLFSKLNIYIPKSSWLWLTLPISVTFHLFLHIDTPFMQMFLAQNDFYIAKAMIILMIFMGVRRIRYSKMLSQHKK